MSQLEVARDIAQGIEGLIAVVTQLEKKSIDRLGQDYGLFQVAALLKCALIDIKIDIDWLNFKSEK